MGKVEVLLVERWNSKILAGTISRRKHQPKHITDAEERKRGEQTGLDTPVVRAVNDEYSVLGILIFSALANALNTPPE